MQLQDHHEPQKMILKANIGSFVNCQTSFLGLIAGTYNLKLLRIDNEQLDKDLGFFSRQSQVNISVSEVALWDARD